MEYICNVTFAVEPGEREMLLEWLRNTALPILFNDSSPARNAALRELVEIGGNRPPADHAATVALLASFSNMDEAHGWQENQLMEAGGSFQTEFPQGIFFVTLLEDLPL